MHKGWTWGVVSMNNIVIWSSLVASNEQFEDWVEIGVQVTHSYTRDAQTTKILSKCESYRSIEGSWS